MTEVVVRFFVNINILAEKIVAKRQVVKAKNDNLTTPSLNKTSASVVSTTKKKGFS